MKPYMVVRLNQDALYDMVPGRDGDLRFLAWAEKVDESRIPHNFTGDHPVYFVENETDGNSLARFLASKKPGTYWVVAKSASSFRSTPGPVVQAAFNEHGMLPVV